MDKSAADRIITEYMPRIYGFALQKTGDSREAEELASDITYEVYLSLLREGEIYHVGAYIWRISSYVFARYVNHKRRRQERNGGAVETIESYVAENGGHLPAVLIDFDDPAALIMQKEDEAHHADDLRRLRREIAYLGETQRKIIVAHYYGGRGVREIAASLAIPEGTVKWHLYDARKTIKEGMKMERNQGKLGVDPIKFESLGHSGCPGTTGDTASHLASRLAQNVAYAAYDEPKTENEIAEELGVSPLYLAEIIEDLENYRFMTRLPDGRLRTDVIIYRPTKASEEAIHAARLQAAEQIAEKYLAQIVANMDAYMEAHLDTLYVPDGDRNLWRWAAFMDGYFRQLNCSFLDEQTEADANAYRYKRPDGGDFIAYAHLATAHEVDFDQKRYFACGLMSRWSDQYGGIQSFQMRTSYDSRTGYWAENLTEDYVILYECYTGRLPETEPNAERYRRLFERGLVVRRDGEISVNVPVMLKDSPALDLFAGVDTEGLYAILRELGESIAAIEVPLYPAHMQACIRAGDLAYPHGKLFMYLYEQMLSKGYLTVPEDDRRGGLMTVVYAEKLPKK